MSETQPPAPAPVEEPTIPPGKPNIAQLIVGILALSLSAAGFAAVLLLDIPEGKLAVITGLLGTMFGWSSGVVTYYFGSSAGSAAKDAQLAQAARRP